MKRSSHRSNTRRAADAVDRHVGARLRLRRLQLQMTVEGVARALRLSPARVNQIECGEVPIQSRWLGVLCDTLDVSPSFFFSGGFSEGAFEAAMEGNVMFGKSIAVAGALLAAAHCVVAQASELVIARNRGIANLPLMVMESEHLVEKHARAAGLDVKVSYNSFAGSALTAEAVLAGRAQIAGGGIPTFLLLWNRTHGGVRALAALNEMPAYLIARGDIHSIKDFRPSDRIGVVTPKASLEAILLEMAAADTFGAENYTRLDNLLVGMPLPEAAAALISGGGLTANFTNPPFSYKELSTPGLHLVLTSRDVLGGPATTGLLYTTTDFAGANSKLIGAVEEALNEAFEMIAQDRSWAIGIYQRIADERYSDGLQRIVDDPTVSFGRTPHGLMQYARFMHRTGALSAAPESWRELFVPDAAVREGD